MKKKRKLSNTMRFSFRFKNTDVAELRDYCAQKGLTQGYVLRRGWYAIRDGEVNINPKNTYGYRINGKKEI